jgi:hypothetical protein
VVSASGPPLFSTYWTSNAVCGQSLPQRFAGPRGRLATFNPVQTRNIVERISI